MSRKTDARGMLEEAPFDWTASKDGKVFIRWQGKQVTILQGGEARRFLSRIEEADGKQAQLIMAKATGNFKRGNEKRPTR